MFFRTLRSYVNNFKPENIFSVWDKKLVYPSTNFRKEAVEYKAQRDYSEMKDIHAFDDVIMSMIKALGIKVIFPRVMEGDDVIAWLTHNLPEEKTIVSVDHDFLQLINNQVSLFTPIKKILITEQNLEEHTKVKPEYFILYKAVRGDTGDNIPGIGGYGAVKAKKLVENWDEHSHKLTTEQLEIIERNKKLVDLSYGYSVYPEEVESYKQQLVDQESLQPNFVEFKKICQEQQLSDILNGWYEWIRPFKHSDPMIVGINSLVERLHLQTK